MFCPFVNGECVGEDCLFYLETWCPDDPSPSPGCYWLVQKNELVTKRHQAIGARDMIARIVRMLPSVLSKYPEIQDSLVEALREQGYIVKPMMEEK